jgi:hypothetical protein
LLGVFLIRFDLVIEGGRVARRCRQTTAISIQGVSGPNPHIGDLAMPVVAGQFRN